MQPANKTLIFGLTVGLTGLILVEQYAPTFDDQMMDRDGGAITFTQRLPADEQAGLPARVQTTVCGHTAMQNGHFDVAFASVMTTTLRSGIDPMDTRTQNLSSQEIVDKQSPDHNVTQHLVYSVLDGGNVTKVFSYASSGEAPQGGKLMTGNIECQQMLDIFTDYKRGTMMPPFETITNVNFYTKAMSKGIAKKLGDYAGAVRQAYIQKDIKLAPANPGV